MLLIVIHKMDLIVTVIMVQIAISKQEANVQLIIQEFNITR